ncbi:hypothetical protein [Streptomyces sp. NPDC046939]|uniref:type IV secretory system conjugative DNA transfer family protein n=1 Tax=Streptomyces sp. NPDC046939 TaxID=3155376 RepID=UPI0033D44E54
MVRDERRYGDERGRGGVPDGLLVGLLAFLLGMTIMVWTATGLAGLFAKGAWPSNVTFGRTPLAMRALIAEPHNIPGAWPDTPRTELSGYGLFWGLLISQLMILVVLAIFVAGTLARWRARRSAQPAGSIPGSAPPAPRSKTAPGRRDRRARTSDPERPKADGTTNAPNTSPSAGATETYAAQEPARGVETGPHWNPAAGTGTGAHLAAGPATEAATGAHLDPGRDAGTETGAPLHPTPGTGTGAHPHAAPGPVTGAHLNPAPGTHPNLAPSAGTGTGPHPYPAPGTGTGAHPNPAPGTGPDAATGAQPMPEMWSPGAGAGPQSTPTPPHPPAAPLTHAPGTHPGPAQPLTPGAAPAPAPGAAPTPPPGLTPAPPTGPWPQTPAHTIPGPRNAPVVLGPPADRHPRAIQAIRDAEGPVLVVTSEPRVWEETKDARAKLGPVLLYDPTHRCDTPARMHWNPATGCTDRSTATTRAAALLAPIRPTARIDSALAETAETLLRSYLHAAAVDGKPFRHVHRWAQGSQVQDAVRILRTNPKAAGGSAGELEAALTSHPDRRDMAQELTARALSALFTVHVREACTPNRTDALTLDSFADEGGTLYVVGEPIEDPKTNPGAMPLLTALASSVVEHGRRMADRSPAGRLDPPMTLVLDDVAAVAPLPQLPELLAAGPDRGLPTLALLRSREQGRSRWPNAELHLP